jgi:hypothetical protein
VDTPSSSHIDLSEFLRSQQVIDVDGTFFEKLKLFWISSRFKSSYFGRALLFLAPWRFSITSEYLKLHVGNLERLLRIRKNRDQQSISCEYGSVSSNKAR